MTPDRDLDQWISKRPFRSFWRDDAQALHPLAIPEFHPTRWLSRHQGTVI